VAQHAIEEGDGAKGPALDSAHLERMTFGDRALARELLGLFERQAALLVDRMRQADPATMAALAHTLKGSASGVGAFEVTAAAAAVEQAPSVERLGELGLAVARARAANAAMLRLAPPGN
jgi:HPt (histidine-containing phosphotransfer) domain-containing protein